MTVAVYFPLVILLGVAAFFDVRERRIPNVLIVLLLLTGVAFSTVTHGLSGLAGAILMTTIGLGLWLPFYALSLLGAGDVKLFAASSAWLAGVPQVLLAAAASAIIGGVLAIAWALIQRRGVSAIGSTLTMIRFRIRIPFERQSQKLPYGVAMAAGILWSFTRL